MAAIPTDVPRAIFMAVLFLAFGIFAVTRPDKLRTAIENLTTAVHESAHRIHLTGEPAIWPYSMPLRLVRFTFGTIGIGGAALCAYVAYLGLSR